MTKYDLTHIMVVELRNGKKYDLNDKNLGNYRYVMKNYNDDLTYNDPTYDDKRNSQLDIVKVYLSSLVKPEYALIWTRDKIKRAEREPEIITTSVLEIKENYIRELKQQKDRLEKIVKMYDERNEKLEEKNQELLHQNNLATSLSKLKEDYYNNLAEKVKEFFAAYHAEETETGEYDEDGFPKTNGLELDEKFKVIAEELKAMVGYKNENE